MELCQIGANQGFTAQTDWDYTSPSRRCRKIVIGSVVRAVKSHSSGKKPKILTQNRKNPEMTVPISPRSASGKILREELKKLLISEEKN